MGVKSLWELLAPVGRPVLLETMEGKSLAIDSSIWIYQFQATMRDKEGRGLTNAHVLGFLRRITKLMFYGIKPVFVFDGGAPVLKRSTLMERKKKKLGAAASHAKVAEKLLAAQLRRQAVTEAEARQSSKSKGKGRATPTERVVLDENTVYLEDLEGTAPTTARAPPPPTSNSSSPTKTSTSTSPTKPRWHDHDPYNLPELDMPAAIAKATRSAAPDPRLATEDELRAIVSELRTADRTEEDDDMLDVDFSSEAFRELPVEVQYELIGDARLRSRTTSHRRLQAMLRGAPTALDFSRAQIVGVARRNALTQQLLETTDSVGKAHVSIPVRVASERGKQYVLMRSEKLGGGWVLGKGFDGDVGTKAKPIKVDIGSDEEEMKDGRSSDVDMEEVPITPVAAMDPDLREYQASMALAGIGSRASPKRQKLLRSANRSPTKKRFRQLFAPEDKTDDHFSFHEDVAEDEDPELLTALQESLEHKEAIDVRAAMELSKAMHNQPFQSGPSTSPSAFSVNSSPAKPVKSPAEDDIYTSPTRLATWLTIGGAAPTSATQRPRLPSGGSKVNKSGPSRIFSGDKSTSAKVESIFGKPTLLLDDEEDELPQLVESSSTGQSAEPKQGGSVQDTIEMSPWEVGSSVKLTSSTSKPSSPWPLDATLETPSHSTAPNPIRRPPASMNGAALHAPPIAQSRLLEVPLNGAGDPSTSLDGFTAPLSQAEEGTFVLPNGARQSSVATDEDDEEMEEVLPTTITPPDGESRDTLIDGGGGEIVSHFPDADLVTSEDDGDMEEIAVPDQAHLELDNSNTIPPPPQERVSATGPANSIFQPPRSVRSEKASGNEESDEEVISGWSRSPSPVGDSSASKGAGPSAAAAEYAAAAEAAAAENVGGAKERQDADWDAAQEMDPVAEEGDFASFVAQVKGRSLDEVRREIDEEIKELNAQRRAAMRDSEDVNAQMVAQIMTMLRLFGIPYMTAPMEAEAQCAALVSLGLVDGVITDDSDVFLFGSDARVYKNMFNQSKTVECFLSTDLTRELGLERGVLVRLAYLLGSDYTDGLPGVGPVVAMELLREFPGDDGLHKFKEWWLKVQMGRDKSEDTHSKFRKRFKKRFRESLFLTDEWPNPAVRDAYYHPTVDESEEPFKWGLPDLDALRGFLNSELGWKQDKVDDLLLPIIRKVGKRGQATALNKQGKLNEFLDVTSGSGTAAPRKRQAYSSKRLQQVVSDFRQQQQQQQARTRNGSPEGQAPGSEATLDETDVISKSKRRTRSTSGKGTRGGALSHATARGKGRKGKTTGRKRKASTTPEVSEDDDLNYEDDTEKGNSGEGPPPAARPRPRPRPRRICTDTKEDDM